MVLLYMLKNESIYNLGLIIMYLLRMGSLRKFFILVNI